MRRAVGLAAACLVLAAAALFKPAFKAWHAEFNRAPADSSIGTVELLSAEQLRAAYSGKRVLVVGGTRGVGRGTALAVASAGAHVAIVGRSPKSGEKALGALRAVAPSREQELEYLQGDLGTVASSKALLRRLEEFAAQHGRFDYFVQTAAVFPDWAELKQEDGLEKGFAIAVVGRYILYKHADRFLKEAGSGAGGAARVLNVLASGHLPVQPYDRALASGARLPTGLLEAINSWSFGNELMQIGLGEHGEHHGTTRVSTMPGMLATDLHDGQGLVMDVVEPIMVALIGISEEDCGVRQASILASPKLHSGGLSYVDENMKGRARSAELQSMADEHLAWLWEFINGKVAGGAPAPVPAA